LVTKSLAIVYHQALKLEIIHKMMDKRQQKSVSVLHQR